VRLQNSIRILFALTVLVCLVALLLFPGATTAVVVRSHATGKQSVRFISVLTILAMAVVCRGLMRVPSVAVNNSRQVYALSFGTDLLDKTCVRLC
jgi:hypothetical protein